MGMLKIAISPLRLFRRHLRHCGTCQHGYWSRWYNVRYSIWAHNVIAKNKQRVSSGFAIGSAFPGLGLHSNNGQRCRRCPQNMALVRHVGTREADGGVVFTQLYSWGCVCPSLVMQTTDQSLCTNSLTAPSALRDSLHWKRCIAASWSLYLCERLVCGSKHFECQSRAASQFQVLSLPLK